MGSPLMGATDLALLLLCRLLGLQFKRVIPDGLCFATYCTPCVRRHAGRDWLVDGDFPV